LLRDSRSIISRLRREGFELVSVRGSHHKFWHSESKRIVIVPHPRKDVPSELLSPSTIKLVGRKTNEAAVMTHYIAIIHKEPDSAFGASFPDVPGVIASAPSLDAVLEEAREALAFAAEDWETLTDQPFPPARTLDELRADPHFRKDAADGVVAAVPLGSTAAAA
jgi:predicted RNA binding protein YcfA (HicA-like mRNA interferase family)/predicted RNase H-like HicB family nuclease